MRYKLDSISAEEAERQIKPMNEMVDRVAKAIHILRHSTPEQQARAAIEAMREPTKAMLSVSGSSTFEDAFDDWRDMIDEALK